MTFNLISRQLESVILTISIITVFIITLVNEDGGEV